MILLLGEISPEAAISYVFITFNSKKKKKIYIIMPLIFTLFFIRVIDRKSWCSTHLNFAPDHLFSPSSGKGCLDSSTPGACQDLGSPCSWLIRGQTVLSMTCGLTTLCVTTCWSTQNAFWLSSRPSTLPLTLSRPLHCLISAYRIYLTAISPNVGNVFLPYQLAFVYTLYIKSEILSSSKHIVVLISI